MLIKKSENRWVAESTYQEKDILKAARWRWNPDIKKWWTDDRDKAAKLIEFADADAQGELQK